MSSKVKHCQIHLAEPYRTDAAAATFPKAGVPAYDAGADRNRAEFTGPHFHDTANVTFGENQVMVQLHDDTIYLYPLHTVARVKFYYTDKTPALHSV